MIRRSIAILAFIGAAHIAAGATAPEVAVTGGTLRGQDMPDGTALFLGIPYAAPPVGQLRWRPAQPVVPWQGIRDATKPPAPCLQHAEGWNKKDVEISREDCLYLSIRSPQRRAHARFPVLFWIHGGSNRAGSGYGYAQDTTLAEREVVLVAIEYRLGVFGFLGSPELTAESTQHASGNYALTDQIAALKWVQANIAKFGGDPANVTIAGQSAGSADVLLLMASPLTQGLFAKAINESGVPGPSRTAAENEKIGSQLLELLHLPKDSKGLEALRAAPATEVLANSDKLEPPQGTSPIWMSQIVDGWVETRPMQEIYAQHRQAHVPMIIGNNTREVNPTVGAYEGRDMVRKALGSRAGDLLELYGGADSAPDDPILGNVGTQFMTDVVFRCPANQVAQQMLSAGVKIWRYEFGFPRTGTIGPVEHSSELNYVFHAVPADATFKTWPPVQQYWANFARTGDPNGPGLPNWPDMGRTLNYISFLPSGPEVNKGLRTAVCSVLTPVQ
ncbi:MAG TPA: carboxylesterase family protein [Steroidobacteraceae bacterium]